MRIVNRIKPNVLTGRVSLWFWSSLDLYV